MNTKIKRALISVSDKSSIDELAKELHALGVEILSSGGTYKHLSAIGIPAIEISSVTGFTEMLDGRVKTLHPAIHAAILANRSDAKHTHDLKEQNIIPIDLVCVNLYPFAETISQKDCSFAKAIENIDIGGITLIRAAAKNHQQVLVLTSCLDYADIISQLKFNGDVDDETRLRLAVQAFSHTTYYDSMISAYLAKQLKQKTEFANKKAELANSDSDMGSDKKTDFAKEIEFTDNLVIQAKLRQTLRYGENAHQKAAFYALEADKEGAIADFVQMQDNKELSYNNLVDADTAWECVKQFTLPCCTIVKHANPCGVAVGANAASAYTKADACDPVSSFGAVIAFNTVVDEKLAQALIQKFVEVIIAPDYDSAAKNILAAKPNIRVLKIKLVPTQQRLEYKSIGGGILVQESETKEFDRALLKTVTLKQADEKMLDDLEFAWKVARFVKSNAIVLVKDRQTIGIGAGQMSRIDATKIAINKAKHFGFTVKGSVAASEAFFPFRDNVDLLASENITAIIQPGGSIKDKEVFAAANEHSMVMVLSGYRIFRH